MADSNPRNDRRVDEALEETFPASDPPANTVETGVQVGPTPQASLEVTDNTDNQRFEVQLDGETAFLIYERSHDALALIHTEVPERLRGHHVGEALAKHAIDAGHAAGLRIVAVCPFVRAYMRRHPA